MRVRHRSHVRHAGFGLIALRRGRLGRTLVWIATASLLYVYCAPLASALLLPGPARARSLEPLSVATFTFPVFRVAPAPKVRRIVPLKQPKSTSHPGKSHSAPLVKTIPHSIRVPIMNSSYGMLAQRRAPARLRRTPAPLRRRPEERPEPRARRRRRRHRLQRRRSLWKRARLAQPATAMLNPGGLEALAPDRGRQADRARACPTRAVSASLRRDSESSHPSRRPSSHCGAASGPTATTITLATPDPAAPSTGDMVTLSATVSPTPDGGTVAFEKQRRCDRRLLGSAGRLDGNGDLLVPCRHRR